MRLIDADALKAKYEQMLPEIGDGYHKETLQDCLFELDYAPTVSPDEVRGVGKWERSECEDGKFWANYCSLCFVYLPYGLEWKPKYCPNCGARLTGGEND